MKYLKYFENYDILNDFSDEIVDAFDEIPPEDIEELIDDINEIEENVSESLTVSILISTPFILEIVSKFFSIIGKKVDKKWLTNITDKIKSIAKESHKLYIKIISIITGMKFFIKNEKRLNLFCEILLIILIVYLVFISKVDIDNLKSPEEMIEVLLNTLKTVEIGYLLRNLLRPAFVILKAVIFKKLS